MSVGNARQPFRRLLEAVASLAGSLPAPVRVQHGRTPFARAGFDCVDFLDMEGFAAAVAAADVVILHAGAGSLITALAAGRTPIVMPRRAAHGEHVDDHQAELAERLAARGLVRVVEDAEGLQAALADILQGRASRPGAAQRKQPVLVQLIAAELNALESGVNESN